MLCFVGLVNSYIEYIVSIKLLLTV